MKKIKKTLAIGMASLLCLGTLFPKPDISVETADLTAYAASETTISDLPSEYQSAADWIWNNRIQGEKSVEAWDTIYDQIAAGKGTLNYVVKWHSYKTITLQQRQNIQQILETAVNRWTDWLVGYDDWPYEHVNVKIVGWAVLDENCLLDRQSDEIVYTSTVAYDSSSDISSGMGDSTIPTVEPAAPAELFRYDHWADKSYEYPGGYENRYDMYLQATQGLIDQGGYGYYWGQQLSDNAVLGLCDGTVSEHILLHEMGHGFGLTDFYGGEGESDGFPPGGFPDGGTSIMMAGSSSVITDFDGWFFRYVWSEIKEESGRFNLSESEQPTTEPATTTVKPVEPDENETILPVTYDSNNNYWLIDTDGNAHITIQAQGLPYAALSGIYGYWDNNSNQWIQDNWMMPESLGEQGISTFTVDIPENADTSQLQIQVNYYAQWNDEANDMVDKDPTGILFSAVGNGKSQGAATTTVTTAATEPPVVTDLKGDVNADCKFNIADVVIMQKWLLSMPDTTLANWKAGDLCEDNILNVFDLCLMKRLLIYGEIDLSKVRI